MRNFRLSLLIHLLLLSSFSPLLLAYLAHVSFQRQPIHHHSYPRSFFLSSQLSLLLPLASNGFSVVTAQEAICLDSSLGVCDVNATKVGTTHEKREEQREEEGEWNLEEAGSGNKAGSGNTSLVAKKPTSVYPLDVGEHLRLQQCRHGPMLYNKHDTWVGKSLEVYGEWCESENRLLKELIGTKRGELKR